MSLKKNLEIIATIIVIIGGLIAISQFIQEKPDIAIAGGVKCPKEFNPVVYGYENNLIQFSLINVGKYNAKLNVEINPSSDEIIFSFFEPFSGVCTSLPSSDSLDWGKNPTQILYTPNTAVPYCLVFKNLNNKISENQFAINLKFNCLDNCKVPVSSVNCSYAIDAQKNIFLLNKN